MNELRSSSQNGTVQPPEANPPSGSSSGPPGACMKRSVPILLGLVFLVLAASPAHATFPGDSGDIAFGRFTHGQNDIWVVAPDSTGTQRITSTLHANESFPDWNADGTKIAFSKCAQSKFGNCDIWVMDADGSNKTRLTMSPNNQETWPT